MLKHSGRSTILCMFECVCLDLCPSIHKENSVTQQVVKIEARAHGRRPAGYEHRPSSAVVTTYCRGRLHPTSSERASCGRTARDKPCLPDTGIFRSRRASWENRNSGEV